MNQSPMTGHPAAEPVRKLAVGSFQIELLPRTAYCASYTASQAIVGFAFDSQSGVHAYGSSRRHAFRTRANSIALVPAGCDVYSTSDCGGEYLRIELPDHQSVVGPSESAVTNMVDSAAAQVAHRIRREVIRAQPQGNTKNEVISRASSDSLSILLGYFLRCLPVAWSGLKGNGLFRESQLQMLNRFIDVHLEEKLTVTTLAQHLGLSTGYFSREIRSVTGRSPHQYLLDRRLMRARQMMLNPKTSLSEIAFACGFSSHAHLSAQFARRLGVSPSLLRSSVAERTGSNQRPGGAE
ncbi:MAG: helix-turn-helix domain-containing protein [Burkholderiaceae bacterium]